MAKAQSPRGHRPLALRPPLRPHRLLPGRAGAGRRRRSGPRGSSSRSGPGRCHQPRVPRVDEI